MRLPIRAFAAALAAGLFGLPVITVPTAAGAAEPSPTVEVVPGSSGLVRGDDEVSFSVRISNPTTEPIPEGSVQVLVERAPVADRSALSLWLEESPDATAIRATPAVTVATPALAAGESRALDQIVVPSTTLGFTSASPFGAHRVSAEYSAGGQEVDGHSAVVTATGTQPSVGLAVAVPIVLPPSADGLVPAELLQEYTSVGGLLYRQLDAAVGRPVALGVDPRIIASIRALGTSAPPAAAAWLGRLEAIDSQIFPLAYADADLAGISQAGGSVLPPASFDLDESLFPPEGDDTGGDTSGESAETESDGEGDIVSSSQAAPEADPRTDDTGGGVPTAGELLAFDYTVTGLAWPRESTVVAADLDAFAAAGLATTILGSEDTSAGELPTTPSASARTATEGGHAVATSDSEVSELLGEAASADTDLEWQHATSELTATLAALAGERANRRPIEGRVVLAALDRGDALTGARLGATLDALAGLDWVSGASLTEALATAPVEVSVVDHPEPEERIGSLRLLTDTETKFGRFSTIVADPELLTRERRLALLALSSHSWTTGSADFGPAVGEFVAQTEARIASVQVSDSSTVNFLQDDGNLPVTVSNGLEYPVTVHLVVRPSTGILDVLDDSVEVTIEPNAQKRAAIPVQSVANGEVTVEIALTTPTNDRVWAPKYVQVNVQAGWETAVTAGLAGLVVLVFAVGILRTVKRRRGQRHARLQPSDAPGDEPSPEEDRP